MALLNVMFLVVDDDTACEDLLIGLAVLRHPLIDSCTFLEQNCNALDGTESSNLEPPTNGKKVGHLGRLLVARMQRIGEEPSEAPATDR